MSICRALLVSATFALGLTAAAGAARAFCVDNATSTPVHVVALDGSGFETDVAPGKTGCNKGAKGQVQVMVVTGYVPVAKNNHPGWRAECQARVAAGGTLRVTGDLKRIACKPTG